MQNMQNMQNMQKMQNMHIGESRQSFNRRMQKMSAIELVKQDLVSQYTDIYGSVQKILAKVARLLVSIFSVPTKSLF